MSSLLTRLKRMFSGKHGRTQPNSMESDEQVQRSVTLGTTSFLDRTVKSGTTDKKQRWEEETEDLESLAGPSPDCCHSDPDSTSTQESGTQEQWLQEIRESQGDYEQEVTSSDEADLYKCFNSCTKNSGHVQFINLSTFRSEHLPERYQSGQKLLDLVKAQADVTCLIKVSYVSPDRPETFPFYDYKGRNDFCRSGTGWVWQVRMHTEKDKGKRCYRSCPCQTCQLPGEPRWAEVMIRTASHVIFDKREAEACKCYFFYDNAQQKLTECPVITGHVNGVFNLRAHDVSEIKYYTHDLVLARKLKEMLAHYRSLCKRLSRKYGRISHVPTENSINVNYNILVQNKPELVQIKPEIVQIKPKYPIVIIDVRNGSAYINGKIRYKYSLATDGDAEENEDVTKIDNAQVQIKPEIVQIKPKYPIVIIDVRSGSAYINGKIRYKYSLATDGDAEENEDVTMIDNAQVQLHSGTDKDDHPTGQGVQENRVQSEDCGPGNNDNKEDMGSVSERDDDDVVNVSEHDADDIDTVSESNDDDDDDINTVSGKDFDDVINVSERDDDDVDNVSERDDDDVVNVSEHDADDIDTVSESDDDDINTVSGKDFDDVINVSEREDDLEIVNESDDDDDDINTVSKNDVDDVINVSEREDDLEIVNESDDDDDDASDYGDEVYNSEHGLVIITSHPHGCSKMVTIGQVTHRRHIVYGTSRYEYNTATCPGSSGAPVFVLGRRTGWTFHPHSGHVSGQGLQQINHSGLEVDY